MSAPTRVLAIAAVFGFGVIACDKPPEPTPPAAPDKAPTASTQNAPAAPAKAATPAKPSEVVYEAPAGWQKAENPNPMRKATFKIPRAEGDPEDAELAVSQAGGTVDANVQRWAGQFERSKDDPVARKQMKVGDLDVTVVELHGTFAGGGMPGAAPAGPKPNWAMLGAIVETQGSLTFFKLTGPEKTVQSAKPAFDKFVEGFRAK
jgi:hypothetical protein